jgi:hypothetical protein
VGFGLHLTGPTGRLALLALHPTEKGGKKGKGKFYRANPTAMVRANCKDENPLVSAHGLGKGLFLQTVVPEAAVRPPRPTHVNAFHRVMMRE